jgi:hypothetical protein
LGLHRIVNNARFLILPWVRCCGLTSRILSGIVKPLQTDWSLRDGYQLLLLDSFVEIPRFIGAYYRAAPTTESSRGGLLPDLPQAPVMRPGEVCHMLPHKTIRLP